MRHEADSSPALDAAGTRRKLALETADWDDRRVRDFIEAIPAMAWSTLADGSNVYVSRRWTEFTGLSAERTAGWGWRDAVHPDDIDRYVENWRAALASGEPFENEARLRRAADGEYRWFLARAEPRRDEQGNIGSWYGLLTDIEDRKRAERAQRDSEAQWRATFENNPAMYFMVDETGGIALVNGAGASQLGYEVGELLGQPVLNVFCEADREHVRKNAERCFENPDQSMRWEARKIRKDGTILSVRETARAVVLKNRLVLLVVCEDITERRRVGDALRASEHRYRHIFETARVAIAEQDFSQVKAAIDDLKSQGVWHFHAYLDAHPGFVRDAIAMVRIIDVNAAALRLFGAQSKDELLGSLDKLVLPETLEVFRGKLIAIAEGKPSFEGETALRTLKGEPLAVLFAITFPPPDRLDSVLVTVTDITERKRTEQALRASEERFRMLVQFSFDAYWESDENHRFTRQEFGEGLIDAPLPGSEIGKTRWEVPYLEPDEEAWRDHRATLAAHRPFRDFELARPTAGGGKRYVSVSGMPMFDDTGRFVGYRGVGRHITERKRAEAALREREKELRELIEAMPAIAWTIRADGSNVFANSRWTEYSGLPAQALSGSAWLAAIHPDDLDLHVKKWRTSVTTGVPFENEARLRRAADGEYRWVLVRAMPLQDDGGKVLQWYGVAMDIEDRKRAEEERAAHFRHLESMDRIHRAIQGTHDLEEMMSDVLDVVLQIFACDRAWLVYPCDPEAPAWRPVMEHTRPEFQGAFAMATDLPVDTEVAAIFKSARAASGAVLFGPACEHPVPAQVAERFSIRSTMVMAVYPKGDQPYLFGLHQCSYPRVWTAQEQRLFQEIGRRLTDALTSLLMFRSLRQSEAKLDEAQRIAHVGYWEHDLATGRTTLSDEGCRIVGLPPQLPRTQVEEWHQRWLHLIHPEDRGRMELTLTAALQSREPYDAEHRVVRPNGEERIVHSRGGVRRDESGQPGRIFGMLQDITELRQAEAEHAKLEERLRQAEKMEAIGRFASGIAHDFNNVLGGIIAYGEMLFDEAPDATSRKRYAQNVLTAATRGRDLVDQILAYTRSQRGKRKPTDVCRTVVETLDLLRSSLPQSISVHTTIPDGPLVIMGDVTQLHQVVMNLCSNAIHALQAGGPLRLAITQVELEVDRALSHGTLRSGRYAAVSVEDGGCGMDQVTLARIFEPFFTTKEIGRGTGLGLALVYAIVSDFGGAIDVESAPGRGSTFSVYVPMADVPAPLLT